MKVGDVVYQDPWKTGNSHCRKVRILDIKEAEKSYSKNTKVQLLEGDGAGKIIWQPLSELSEIGSWR